MFVYVNMYTCSKQFEGEKNTIMDSGSNDKSGAESQKFETGSEMSRNMDADSVRIVFDLLI